MSKPTCRELLESVRHSFDRELVVAGQEVDLAARVERVLAMHDSIDRDYCDGCGERWPCPTVRLLDGGES